MGAKLRGHYRTVNRLSAEARKEPVTYPGLALLPEVHNAPKTLCAPKARALKDTHPGDAGKLKKKNYLGAEHSE